MEPFLIYTDNRSITAEKNALTAAVTYVQGVYDALKALGITASLSDLSNLTGWQRQADPRNKNFASNYVTQKLADQAMGATFNGVALQRDKLLDLISVPDLTNMQSALQNYGSLYQNMGSFSPGIRYDLLTLTDDIIAKVADSDSTIEGYYTFYTQTDVSTTLATQLQAVCDALNAYNAANSNAMANAFKGAIGFEIPKQVPINGLALLGTTFVVSLRYIRNFEAGMGYYQGGLYNEVRNYI